MSKFGLDTKTITAITCILHKYTTITKVIIFGSRATGTYKRASDIDLAIWVAAPSNVRTVISKLYQDLEESTIPYTFDILDYNSITNAKLRDEIDKFGQLFYE